MRKTLCSAFLLAVALMAHAEVRLPKIFGDNMVLQQQTECNLWGSADANKLVKIRTSWNGKTYKVQTDGKGQWRLAVQTPTAGGPYDITFSDGKELVLRNVLIGEVWVCSGQSNMEMPMKGFKGQPVEGAAEELMRCRDQRLHLFTVKRNAQLNPVDTLTGTWQEANSESVRQFSATAYYYGKMLRKALDVPVGLIVTAWGGSACEAWMNKEWVKSDWLKAFPKLHTPWNEADVKAFQQRCPSAMYNGMLHPVIGYTMKGVIWYQGEDNCNRYETYADQLQTMVNGWRTEWKQGDFPFYFCQIAPYDYDLINWKDNSALLREQQLLAEQRIPNCRMAVLMDAGLEYGIHPRKKRQAGERLALLSLANTYAMKGLPEFAAYKSVTFQGDTAVVSFDRSKEWVYFNNGPESDNFEVAGEDKVFHKAKAWTSRNKVYVKCSEVKHPVAVRYAFRNWVVGDLFHDGLPVSSFRTDNFKDETNNETK